MRKLIVLVVFALVALGLTSAGSTYAMPENFGGEGEAWTNDYTNHYVNNNNPEVRFDWTNHHMAVPGEGGHHADDNAAVRAHGDQTLVDVPSGN